MYMYICICVYVYSGSGSGVSRIRPKTDPGKSDPCGALIFTTCNIRTGYKYICTHEVHIL